MFVKLYNGGTLAPLGAETPVSNAAPCDIPLLYQRRNNQLLIAFRRAGPPPQPGYFGTLDWRDAQFTPDEVTRTLWLHAPDLALAQGAAIANWQPRTLDLPSPGFRHSDATRRPLYQTAGVVGLPAALFDGLNDFLRHSSDGTALTPIVPTGAGGSYTKIVVAKLNSVSTGNNLLSANGTTHSMRTTPVSSLAQPRITHNAAAANAGGAGLPMDAVTPAIVSGAYSAAADMVVVWRDGKYGNSALAAGANTDATLLLGALNAGASVVSGLIPDALFSARLLRPEQHGAIVQWLATRYGIGGAQPLMNVVFRGSRDTFGFGVTGAGTITGDTYPAKMLAALSLTDGVNVTAINSGTARRRSQRCSQRIDYL